MDNHEIRAGLPVALRAHDDGGVSISGYAAVFDSETNIGGMFTEVIRRGAFTNAIARDDVLLLVNHQGMPLARTKSGTLTLREDNKGLLIESRLDTEDPDAKAVEVKMRRGDLDKMSFAFIATRQEWSDSGELPKRDVFEASLFDVSIVNTPAYESTSVALRSFGQYMETMEMSSGNCPIKRGQQLGDLLASLRDEAEVTNAALGTAAGISESTVGEIIAGGINCPPIDRLRGFAKVLNVPLSRLRGAAEADGCDYSSEENSSVTKNEVRQIRMKQRFPYIRR